MSVESSRSSEGGLRILLVEDNDDIRSLLRFWLEDDERCAQVAEATSPTEAISLARDGELDAVVLDYMLTGGTAADCLPDLRILLPNARIIVYTANRAAAIAAGVRDLGADLVVDKNVVVEDVVGLVLTPAGRPFRRPP